MIRRSFDQEPRNASLGEGPGAPAGNPAGRRETLIVAERKIFTDRLPENKPLRLAVFGHKHDAVREGVGGAVEPHDFAVNFDGA